MRILPSPRNTAKLKTQRGSAILIILTIIGIGAAFMLVSAFNKATQQTERDKVTTAALVQAKEALIGFAVTYRDAHPNEVFGYLPCPDTNNDGVSDSPCGATDVTVIGRLPWRTLGLPPLRDGGGECLWYAVSGHLKDNPKTPILNWDTTGQFIVQDAGSVVLAGATPSEQPVAVIFAPRQTISGQVRTPVGTTECGGSNTSTDYLEAAPISAVAGATSTVKLSTAASAAGATNNDQGSWITSKDLFSHIKKRTDFKSDIDTMMIDLRDCLNSKPIASLPAASIGNKGIDNAITACPTVGTTKVNVLKNWKENLLYAKLPVATKITLDGALTANTCTAVLIFGGERGTRTIAPLTVQTRTTVAEKGNAVTFGDPAMYLENANATSFPAGTTYKATSKYSIASPAQDLAACITGILPGATQASFANSLGSFTPVGAGVSSDPVAKTVTIISGGGATGGCFWYPFAIQLNTKTLRTYYEFAFSTADPVGGVDHGNGFTLSFLRGDVGAPTACGTATNMGTLDVGTTLGSLSYFVENDVHHDSVIQLDAINVDPAGNHTAIMANGNLTHSVTAGNNGYTTSACNGTAQGCLYTPADKFEESPTPLAHNQRIEIHTGCNNTCSSCNIAGTYAKIQAWTDCASCNDTAIDFASTATVNRCTLLDPALNTFYFGFTGGFTGGAAVQGVTIQNFILQTQ